MASTADRNESVAESSSAMRQDSTPSHTNRRFAAFVDDDDHDTGGGVLLRDFEDDSLTGGSYHIPTPTNSTASSGNNARASQHSRKNAMAGSFEQPATSGRRNTIAPIGTGRYSENSKSGNGGVSLNATVNAWMNEKTADQEDAEKSDSVRQFGNFTGAASQAQTGQDQTGPKQTDTMSHIYSQNNFDQTDHTSSIFSPSRTIQNTQFGYSYSTGVAPAVNMNTPSTRGRAVQHSQSANALSYPWDNTPVAYNSAGFLSHTPQTSGYRATQGIALGANFPSMNTDATPSHMPQKLGKNPTTTPQSESLYSQYNQTEPRNFAPRAGTAPAFVPPPTFNLSRQEPVTTHDESQSQYTMPNSDPFMSPAAKNARDRAYSQALVLPSVPEENQMALVSRQMACGPIPAEIRAMRSAQLNKLTEGPMGLPTREIALDPANFPFIESTTQAAPVGYGVVKIRNIPFATKRAEIIAFLGRNSKILNDNQEPVHIIMERVSSKTQDAYVEFMTTQDAVRAVDRHRENQQKGRPSRLGERPVEVLLSSQAALMQDLFPLASGVWWDNGKPVIQAPVDGQPWKTFKGFVTEEEMTMLVKHVEVPQRSPYSKECPQRPYECMISTIKKLPWYMADRITLRQRHAIYQATVKLIELLKQALQHDNRHHNQQTVINPQLLKRLVTAAMLCPGFSVVQKDNIAVLADMDQDRALMFNQPRLADQWVHLHGICPKPGVPLDVLEWYVAIIREETTRYIHRKHVVERNEIQRTSCYTSLYFGYIWYEISLPDGKELENLSLHEVARRELAIIERAFRRAFPPANALEE